MPIMTPVPPTINIAISFAWWQWLLIFAFWFLTIRAINRVANATTQLNNNLVNYGQFVTNNVVNPIVAERRRIEDARKSAYEDR